MKVKFLQDVHSGIGFFQAGQTHELEDEHIINNWTECGLIEEVKTGKKKPVRKNED